MTVSCLSRCKKLFQSANNGFCLHCTDFFPETKMRSHFLCVGGSGGFKWGSRWGQGVGEPIGEPPPTPSRPPFGPHDPRHRENKIAFLFREKTVLCKHKSFFIVSSFQRSYIICADFMPNPVCDPVQKRA